MKNTILKFQDLNMSHLRHVNLERNKWKIQSWNVSFEACQLKLQKHDRLAYLKRRDMS